VTPRTGYYWSFKIVTSIHSRHPHTHFRRVMFINYLSRPIDGHYDLVSGYYGPGVFVSWFITFGASLIAGSQTSNPFGLKDTVTGDFITGLFYLVTAIGHAAVQVYQYPGKSASIWITDDPELMSKAASIQSSIRVCDFFLLFGFTYTFILYFLFHGDCVYNNKSIKISRLPLRRLTCIWIGIACCLIVEVAAGFHGGLKGFLLELFGTWWVSLIVCM